MLKILFMRNQRILFSCSPEKLCFANFPILWLKLAIYSIHPDYFGIECVVTTTKSIYFEAKPKHIIPVPLPKKKLDELMNITLNTHKLINCRGVTRSDFKYFKARFYLLEINTQPGMTKLSLVPEIANYYGINFYNLIRLILKDASTNK